MKPPAPISNGESYTTFISNGNVFATAANTPVWATAACTFANCAKTKAAITKDNGHSAEIYLLGGIQRETKRDAYLDELKFEWSVRLMGKCASSSEHGIVHDAILERVTEIYNDAFDDEIEPTKIR